MQSTTRLRAIRRVLILILILNLLVAGVKLAIGLITGSLSMVADGIHSSLDAASNAIGLVAVAFAARPPDQDHPYGHRRFETIASMLLGGLLLLTAWELIQSSIARFSGSTEANISAINFAAMIVTLAINIAVSTYERREGRRLNSEFLVADSAHTGSDIFVSSMVIVGLIAVRLGWTWADPVAALVVVALIARAAWRIIQEAAAILVDRAALNPEEVRRVVEGVPGIERVARIRSRGPADEIFLDLTIEVPAPMTANQTAILANEARSRLRQQFDGLRDIQIGVQVSGGESRPRDYALIARAEGDALGIGVHEVIAATTKRGLVLEMHVEVSPDQTVGQAHNLVTQFEERMRVHIPELQHIVTHIEPAHSHEQVPVDEATARRLARMAIDIARRLHPEYNWHDVSIRAEADGGYAVSMHCHVADDMSLESAHRIAEQTETAVRAALTAIHRVTIHTEPPNEGGQADEAAG